MTAVEPTLSHVPRPQRKPLTPLEGTLQQRGQELIDLLVRIVARTCRFDVEEAEDVVHNVLASAIKRERKGEGWDPKGRFTIERYLLCMVWDEVANHRRSKRRKPATPVGDATDLASASPDAEQSLVAPAADANDDLEELLQLAADLRRHFEEETGGRIALGLMDHHMRGIHEYGEIAKALHCTTREVKNAWERVKHHGARLVKAARGRKDAS